MWGTLLTWSGCKKSFALKFPRKPQSLGQRLVIPLYLRCFGDRLLWVLMFRQLRNAAWSWYSSICGFFNANCPCFWHELIKIMHFGWPYEKNLWQHVWKWALRLENTRTAVECLLLRYCEHQVDDNVTSISGHGLLSLSSNLESFKRGGSFQEAENQCCHSLGTSSSPTINFGPVIMLLVSSNILIFGNNLSAFRQQAW